MYVVSGDVVASDCVFMATYDATIDKTCLLIFFRRKHEISQSEMVLLGQYLLYSLGTSGDQW